MSAPGDVVSAWGEPDIGYAVILASSRHKRIVTEGEGRAILAASELVPLHRARWRSHTKRYLDTYGCHCDGDGWCEEGNGRAWQEVLYARDAKPVGDGS